MGSGFEGGGGVTQTFFIPGPLPGLNTLIDAAKEQGYVRRGWNGYANAKRQWGQSIYWEIMKVGLKPMRRVYVSFVWHEQDRRRDPDNFSSGGKKFVLDALVKAGVLKNDGWDEIAGMSDMWKVDKKRPGVQVTLEER